MELLKLLNANEIAVQVLSFLLLFIILRAFFWKRFLKLLDERREKIASEFKDIEDAKASIEEIKKEFEAKLRLIDDAAKARIQEAINEGSRIIEEAKKIAHEETIKLLESGKKEVQYEVLQAKEALKDQVANLVLRATEDLMEELITEDKDERIVKDFLNRLDEIK